MTKQAKSLANSLTREGLLKAMKAYDRGADAFHAKHGTTERGCKYWIRQIEQGAAAKLRGSSALLEHWLGPDEGVEL